MLFFTQYTNNIEEAYIVVLKDAITILHEAIRTVMA